ncbi:MAG: M20/M25/M40 family metallo-hydrolase [Porticoccaceae bacterium]|nr:M20/M25/M40 family metallo-hydrolase [Porticoccaceae bacterium]
MKRLFNGSIAAIGLLIALVVVRTLMHQPPASINTDLVEIELNEAALAERLSQSIQFQTISFQSPELKDQSQFSAFIDWVHTSYPRVHQSLDYIQLNDTMLYRWPGSDASLQPILVTGHYDVVPVIPGSESQWQQPPFSGAIVDGLIWGRGALDDKSGVLGILEAVTYLLDAGHQPQRTVYLSFGHDEEIGGREGAAAVAAYLKDQGVQLAWSLDEGSFIFDGLIAGVDSLVAAINVAEKGSITLDIVAAAEGGHSSMPPQTSAITDLARAITQLEEHPVPGGLEGLAADMFDNISRHMPFVPRVFFANQWLFDGLINDQLSGAPTTNAMLRTTTAPTMLSGSVKTNVLPIEAVATVNFRIHPRDSMDSIESYVTDLVASDSISVHRRGGADASAVSDWKAPGFAIIAQSMREIHGDIPVAPGLMIAASDSRHYGKVADNAYRFNPIRLTPELLTGFHGTNEKIAVADYAQGVRGYIRIIAHGTAQ